MDDAYKIQYKILQLVQSARFVWDSVWKKSITCQSGIKMLPFKQKHRMHDACLQLQKYTLNKSRLIDLTM